MESVSKPTGGADTADSGQWAAGINRVTIEQGAIGFTDHGVQPPAAMNIQDLQLTIDEISNQQGGAFPINLTGGLMEGGSFTPALWSVGEPDMVNIKTGSPKVNPNPFTIENRNGNLVMWVNNEKFYIN